MAQDLNVWTGNGRLTRDAESRQAGDTTILSLRLAVNGRKKVAGNWEDKPSFFDVTYFPRVDWMAERLVKGARVSITGRLELDEWEGKDGQKRSAVKIIASDLWPLDARGDVPAKQTDDLGGALPGDWGGVASKPVGGGGDPDIPFAPSRA